MKVQIKRIVLSPNIFLVLASALVLRLLLFRTGTLFLDFNTFVGWSNRLVEVGFSRFYQAWSDYLPGYLYFLYFLGKIKNILVVDKLLLFKLPGIFADILTGFLIYKIVADLKDKKWGLIASSIYLFNPAIFANSTLWGQVDSLTALFSILSIYLIDKSFIASSIFLSIGTLIKPQAALAAPVLLFSMLRKKWEVKKILLFVALSFVVFVLGFYPFKGGENLVPFIFDRIGTTLGQYPYTSVNAFNFWGLFGFWAMDTPFVQFIGYAATIGFFVVFARNLWKKSEGEYLLLTVAFFTSFLFFTRMHERHLLPTFAPLAIASSLNPAFLLSYFGLSITYLFNLYYSFNWISNDFAVSFSPLFTKLLIIFNLLFFAFFIANAFIKRKKPIFLEKLFRLGLKRAKKFTLKELIPKPKVKKLVLILLIFTLATRLVGISSPQKEYFDEVYHAFTARRILANDPKAWEWWNTPPEGFAYEWTHPPLAKELMVLGMLVFGENAFGWRIPAALAGTLSVYLVFLIARFIFKNETVAFFASLALSLDGLFLVMSRIGMNDIYFLTFSLLAVYLFLKDRHFTSSLALGLALATKWSAVWAIPLIFVSHFVFKKKFSKGYLWFLLIPPFVYLASYIPMFLTGHGLDIFIGVQKQMWWYHTGLEATHSYTSSWWTWPILTRPIWLFTSGEANGVISNIYAIGNPIVFWFGLTSIIIVSFWAFSQRNKKLGFVIFSYLIFFVTWAASPRIMFLYHYLPSLPFMGIAIGYVLTRFPKLILPFFAASFVLFIYFYPHLTGIAVPTSLDASYYWFQGWR